MIFVNKELRRVSAFPSPGAEYLTEEEFFDWAAPLVRSYDQSVRPASTVEALQRLLRRRILERRRELQASPFPIEVSAGKTLLIQVDDATLANLTGKLVLGLAGADGGAPAWKQADGSWISLTQAEVVAAAAGYGARKQHLFTREASLAAELSATSETQALLAFAGLIEVF